MYHWEIVVVRHYLTNDAHYTDVRDALATSTLITTTPLQFVYARQCTTEEHHAMEKQFTAFERYGKIESYYWQWLSEEKAVK